MSIHIHHIRTRHLNRISNHFHIQDTLFFLRCLPLPFIFVIFTHTITPTRLYHGINTFMSTLCAIIIDAIQFALVVTPNRFRNFIESDFTEHRELGFGKVGCEIL